MQAREAWASVASTNDIQPRGVSDETLSKIFQTDHATNEGTLNATTHLNFCGLNTSLSHKLVTN